MKEISIFIYLVGVMSLLFGRVHLLSMLLSFEMIMLGVFLSVVSGALFYLYGVMTFLTLVVCEASLGLGIVVLCVFYYGNEYVGSVSVLQC